MDLDDVVIGETIHAEELEEDTLKAVKEGERFVEAESAEIMISLC